MIQQHLYPVHRARQVVRLTGAETQFEILDSGVSDVIMSQGGAVQAKGSCFC